MSPVREDIPLPNMGLERNNMRNKTAKRITRMWRYYWKDKRLRADLKALKRVWNMLPWRLRNIKNLFDKFFGKEVDPVKIKELQRKESERIERLNTKRDTEPKVKKDIAIPISPQLSRQIWSGVNDEGK